jgi:hypothetical protein
MATTIFRYSRPDESFIGGSVSGAVDVDFNANSLINGSPGDPVKKTGGLSMTATSLAAVNVGIVAACNHNTPAGTITIGGGVTASIVVPAYPANAIPLNNYALVTPVSASSVTVAASGSVMGELWVGAVRTLERGIMVDADLAPAPTFEWIGEFGSIPPNDEETDFRTLGGTAIVSETGLADIVEWWRSTRRGIYPTLIVPFDGVNDAWLVTFTYSVKISWKHPTTPAGSIYKVTFDFKELPRTRW